jgi:Sensors of blue-light using FAD
MLIRLVYTSRSTEMLSPAGLDGILGSSRKNNPPNGITGVLCTNGSVFLQMLEGGRREVNETYNRIIKDPRHHDIQLLHFTEVTERKFASWSMGKVSFDRVNMAILLKHSSRAVLDPYSVSGAVSVALLEDLMATANIGS